MREKLFAGIAFSLMLFLATSCNVKVQDGQDSVSVSGIGTVLAQPDMVVMNVSFSHTAPTTKQAKTEGRTNHAADIENPRGRKCRG